LREHPTYRKESRLYKKPSYSSLKRENDNSVLNLGIIGENVVGNSIRRTGKGNSLDIRLPKIGDSMFRKKERTLTNQNSIDHIKLPNVVEKYKHGKYFINKPQYKKYPLSKFAVTNVLDSNMSQLSKKYRYKYSNKEAQEKYNSYVSNPSLKHTSSIRALEKLRMYQNGTKNKK
jgi:hypothetical protein